MRRSEALLADQNTRPFEPFEDQLKVERETAEGLKRQAATATWLSCGDAEVAEETRFRQGAFD